MHADVTVSDTRRIAPNRLARQARKLEAANKRDQYTKAVGEYLIAKVLATCVTFERILPHAYCLNKEFQKKFEGELAK